jgi:hypothetical protein
LEERAGLPRAWSRGAKAPLRRGRGCRKRDLAGRLGHLRRSRRIPARRPHTGRDHATMETSPHERPATWVGGQEEWRESCDRQEPCDLSGGVG